MTRLHQMFVALALGIGSTLAAAAEVVVIVNPTNTTTSMTVDQVQEIYLGKTTTLPAGGYASAVDLANGSPTRDAFYQKATGKSSAQVKAVWTRLLFSGRNTPPKALGTSAEVKKFVASNPNGIGYIEKSAADSSVKVVLTLP
ncbi:MAG: phosphate ABC transporter substrate-binding protein [Gammaproteobacteria bacterium]